MKKILLTIAIVTTMSLGATAQNVDGFYKWSDADNESYRYSSDGVNFELPPYHGTENDYDSPLGSGLLILTALGAGYIVRQKSKH